MNVLGEIFQVKQGATRHILLTGDSKSMYCIISSTHEPPQIFKSSISAKTVIPQEKFISELRKFFNFEYRFAIFEDESEAILIDFEYLGGYTVIRISPKAPENIRIIAKILGKKILKEAVY